MKDHCVEPQCNNCQASWDTAFVSENISKAFAKKEYKDYVGRAELATQKTLLVQDAIDEAQRREDAIAREVQRALREDSLYFCELFSFVPCPCFDYCGCGYIENLRRAVTLFRLAPSMSVGSTKDFLKRAQIRQACMCVRTKKDKCTCGYDEEFAKVNTKCRIMRRGVEILDMSNFKENYAFADPHQCMCTEQLPLCTCGVNRELDRAAAKEKTVGFVYKCCVGECDGYVVNWKCISCAAKMCASCLQERKEGEEHVCDASGLLIKKDTKPCPGCGTGVFRIDGCPQMFCTICKTAFDFHSGQRVKGVVHNPHYFEWVREHGGQRRGNAVDDGCQDMMEATQTINHRYGDDAFILRNIYNGCHRDDNVVTHHRDYAPLRKKLLNKELNQAAFDRKVSLQRTRLAFYEERQQLLDFTFQAASDIVVGCVRQYISEDAPRVSRGLYRGGELFAARLKRAFAQIEQLRTYTNKCLKEKAVVHAKTVEYLDESMIIKRLPKAKKVVVED